MLKKLGVISVDAGCVWIGDPCYIFHNKENPKDVGKSWDEFCGILDDKGFGVEGAAQFNFDGKKEFPGLGVVTETAWGDGTYPVYGKFVNDRLMNVIIYLDGSCDEDNPDEPTGFEEKDEDEF